MNPANWWIWMILAAIFAVGEIFTAGFFLLCIAFGAAAAGLLGLAGAGALWQWLAFAGISLAAFLASRPFAERISKKQPPGVGADRFSGQPCVVLEAIDNTKGAGRVRMDHEEWRAESETGEPIAAGAHAVVTAIKGNHLVVRVKEGD
jgi:membrane protein implicated in regulation of membrane protease activity